MALILCQGCQRHVRGSESACPFCKAAIVAGPELIEVGPTGPVTRSHVTGFAVGAVAISSVLFGTACPVYGGPPERSDAEIRRAEDAASNDAASRNDAANRNDAP